MIARVDSSGNLMTVDQYNAATFDGPNNAQQVRVVGISSTLLSALAIRDTVAHSSGAVDVSKLMGSKSIAIIHTFDQPVTSVSLTLWNGASAPVPAVIYTASGLAVTSAAGMVLARGAAPTGAGVILASIDQLADPFQWVQLAGPAGLRVGAVIR